MSAEIQTKYFTQAQRVYKMSREEIQALIKKLNLPIKRNTTTLVMKDRVVDRLRMWRDKALASIPVVKPKIPKVTIAELNKIIESLETEYEKTVNLTWDQIQPNLQNIIDARAPTFYVRGVATYISADDKKHYRTERLYTKIRDDLEKSDYIEQIHEWLFEYNFVKTDGEQWKLQHVDLRFQKTIGEKTQLVRVADYEAENCVINVLRGYLGNVDSVYEKYPDLKPNCKKVYINHEKIEEISRYLNVNICTYTKLGARLNQPWHKYGTGKRKQIPICIHNEHATIQPGKIKVSSIEYHEILNIPTTTDVVDEDFDEDNIPKYYTQLRGGKLIMHKSFRPSSITKNPADDEDIDLAYHFSTEQTMYYMFKSKYNLEPIPDPTIRAIAKQAEHFIGKRVLEELRGSNYTEFDHNKNYVSYETSPYYIGFPTNKLIPMKEHCARNPAFYICSDIINPPKCFQLMYNYKQGPITLAQPMVEFLRNLGTQLVIDYVLDGEFQQISVLDFAESFDVPINKKKDFCNQLVGRTITGGIREAKPLRCRYSNEAERDQLIYEAQTNDLNFGVDAEHNKVTVEIKNQTKGFFNFHSYILAYAATHIMSKWLELETKTKIVAYNVDAIVVENIFTETSDKIGGWKTQPLKPYYKSLKVSSEIKDIAREIIPVKVPSRELPTCSTVVSGSAGISKSYPWLSDPAHSQIVLVPTHELKNAHKQYFDNTHTAHKYFQFGIGDKQFNYLRMAGKIPHEHTYVVVDERTMFTKRQWEIIERRKGNSIIIALGDSAQIRNQIDSAAVTDEWFSEHKYSHVEIQRCQGKIARHSYEFGSFLDTLRYQPYEKQIEYILQRFEKKEFDITHIDLSMDNVVVGTHEAALRFNQLAREHARNHNLLFPFRTVGKQPQTVMLPHDTKKVFWTRKSMTDERPAGTKYEPYFAVTADALQGKTLSDLSMLYVDVDSLRRYGCLYTSMTRTRSSDNIVII